MDRLGGGLKSLMGLGDGGNLGDMGAMYGTFSRNAAAPVAGDYTIVARDVGRIIPFDCTAAGRICTMPVLASVDEGFAVGIFRTAGSNALTVARNATDGGGTVALPGAKALWVIKIDGGWQLSHAGEVLQRHLVAGTNFASTTATTPALDDTIPQITEGFSLYSTTFTPVSSASGLRFVSWLSLGASASMTAAYSLFLAGGADAVATVSVSLATDMRSLVLRHDANSFGAGVATAVEWRCGKDVAGTLYFNGLGGSRKYGGTLAAIFLIEEYLP